jgi:hypothetical protein
MMNSKFHEKLLDDDPAGSKYAANVHNRTNDNTVTLVIYYESDSCIIILYIIHNRIHTIKINVLAFIIIGTYELC